MEERCEKHGLLIGQCSICKETVTKDNHGHGYGGLTRKDLDELTEYGRGVETTKKRFDEETKVKGDVMEEVQMKVCSKCKGDPKPITEFHKNHLTKDGYAGTCKSCKSKMNAAFNLKKKKKKGVKAKKLKTGVEAPFPGQKITRGPDIPLILQLDVSDYPEILDALKAMAKKSIRTIEHQALMLVRMGLMMDGYLSSEKEAKEPGGKAEP